jgi:hypothetical protein
MRRVYTRCVRRARPALVWLIAVTLLFGGEFATRDADREVIGAPHIDGEHVAHVEVATSPTAIVSAVRGRPTYEKTRLMAALVGALARPGHAPAGPVVVLPWERPRQATIAVDTSPTAGRAPPAAFLTFLSL